LKPIVQIENVEIEQKCYTRTFATSKLYRSLAHSASRFWSIHILVKTNHIRAHNAIV